MSSYLAFSPLLVPAEAGTSGIFSVALSVNPVLHRAALTFIRRVALWCPDFPLAAETTSDHPGALHGLSYTPEHPLVKSP